MFFKLALVALLATGLNACQRDRKIARNGHTKRAATTRAALTPDEQLIISSFDANKIDDWSYYYTHGLHLAGKNESMAQWTADHWTKWGIPSSLAAYNVYLDYPVSKSMVITFPNGTVFRPELEEDVLAVDETTSYPNRVPTFHGYSASGEATAEYVYVGRGQQDDYQRLVDLGIDLKGKIALAMYGGPFRGLKVKNAQDQGMIGAVIFTDPVDDGDITVANGYVAYPDGPARNPTSVQRGSVEFLSTYPGDPSTPGYPSIGENIPRADVSVVTPQIPSIPISYQNAQTFLAALDGYGFTNHTVGRPDWVGALNATYSTGPAPGVQIQMSNYMQATYTDLWNAIGIINGTNADETLVIGNHRDAWIIGGAADPNSGTAIIVELARVMGKLLAQGWQPRRNIVLCSWDGEEYGLVGSTEWVEQYIPWLTDTVVSYLNIDVGVSGPRPGLSATPELHDIATETMKKVMWDVLPGNKTLYDVWYEESEGEVGVLGSGSDYTAFLHKGMASLDVGSDNGPTDPVYHYHSDYDSYHWMSTFGDPGFVTHKSMGQYLTLLAYHLASDEVLPLNPENYATQMDIYYKDLRDTIDASGEDIDTSEVRDAIDTFAASAKEAAELLQQAVDTGDEALVQVVNHKYRDYQRGFTSQGGLPNREFYRHVVFAPGLDTGYAAVTFPGITEGITFYNASVAREWVPKTAAGIRVAANILKM